MKSNKNLKRLIIEAVDNQLKENNPPAAKSAFERLVAAGYTREYAKEKIAAVVLCNIYDALKDRTPFNAEKYIRELNLLK